MWLNNFAFKKVILIGMRIKIYDPANKIRGPFFNQGHHKRVRRVEKPVLFLLRNFKVLVLFHVVGRNFVAFDKLLDFRWARHGLRDAQLFQLFGQVDFASGVLGDGHGAHKVVQDGDELVLVVEGAVVEVEQLGRHLERHQETDRLPVADGGRVQDDVRAGNLGQVTG